MAFDFPNPPTGNPVTNPETGITYKYDAASDTWIVTASTVQEQYYTKDEVDNLIENADAPGIHEGPTPPTIEEGQPPQLWYNTNTLELYFYYCDDNGICAWVPTATPLTELASVKAELEATGASVAVARIETAENFQEIQNIKAGLGQVDLQEVLDNGNVADHAIELTDGSDDLIIISPEQAVVGIASDLATKNPRFRLAHVDSQGYPDSHAQWEIDNNGTRSDLELSGDIEGFHVRFDDTEKLLLDNKGNVELKGGIKTKGDVDLKIGTGETITIDSGSSYEPMLHLKSYSSTTEFGVEDPINPEPRARKDVFIVNARGNAELLGNLSLAPGTQNQHAVTYSQLVEVEEEIESIVPSLERGQWDIHLSDLTSSDEGKFNLLRPFSQADAAAMQAACDAELEQCIRNPNIDEIDCQSDHDRCVRRIPAVGTGAYPTDDFASVESIKFSAKDVNGVTHSWSDVKPGMMIDVFNQDDDSYVLAEILSVVGTGIVTFDVKVIQYKGKATGRCRIKIFELDLDAGNSTDFVRKSGDTMTGKLVLQPSDTGNDVLQVKDPNSNKMFIVGSDNDTLAKVVVQGSKEFKIGTTQRQVFKIYSDSTCRLSSLRDPTSDTDAVNRKYVDDAVASVSHGDDGLFGASYWTLDTSMDRDEVTDGKFHWDGSELYMARSTASKHTWCPGAQGWRTTNAWVTIYSKDGDLMHTFEVNRINFKEKYGKKYIVEFEDAWDYKTRDLVDGEEYRIVIPGFLT